MSAVCRKASGRRAPGGRAAVSRPPAFVPPGLAWLLAARFSALCAPARVRAVKGDTARQNATPGLTEREDTTAETRHPPER